MLNLGWQQKMENLKHIICLNIMVMKPHGRKYNNQRELRYPTMGSSENHLFSKVPAFSRGKPPPQKPKIPKRTWNMNVLANSRSASEGSKSHDMFLPVSF